MHGQRCREVPESTSQAEGKESRIYTCFAGGPGVPAFDPSAMALSQEGKTSILRLPASISQLTALTHSEGHWVGSLMSTWMPQGLSFWVSLTHVGRHVFPPPGEQSPIGTGYVFCVNNTHTHTHIHTFLPILYPLTCCKLRWVRRKDMSDHPLAALHPLFLRWVCPLQLHIHLLLLVPASSGGQHRSGLPWPCGQVCWKLGSVVIDPLANRHSTTCCKLASIMEIILLYLMSYFISFPIQSLGM